LSYFENIDEYESETRFKDFNVCNNEKSSSETCKEETKMNWAFC
jgi:hypothetical protein